MRDLARNRTQPACSRWLELCSHCHRGAQIDTHVRAMLHVATFLKAFATTVLIGVGTLIAFHLPGTLGGVTNSWLVLFAAFLTVVTALVLRG
jgi:hypothetical protein